MMHGRAGYWAAVVVVSLAASGCGSADRTELITSASDALNGGLQAYDAQDYPAAAEQLGQALSSGVVNPDDAGPIGVKRAIALAKSDQLDAALTELDELAKQAPNLDEVLAARAFVLAKQGKRQEAAAALAQAKRHNPRVKLVK